MRTLSGRPAGSPGHEDGQALSVSFAVPVLNEESRIGRCLSSIRAQEYPRSRVEILVLDGGSTDNTVAEALEYGATVSDNPDRLSEFGLKRAMLESRSDLVVVFAADNEIPEPTWLVRMASLFEHEGELAAAWCDISASCDDPPISRYQTMIKSDPLTYFANRNLSGYLEGAEVVESEVVSACFFRVDPSKPIPWGANGLVYRRKCIQEHWRVPGYLGDNDAFQTMVASGKNLVAYVPDISIYHHSVTSLKEWRKKFARNFGQHFISHFESRNMNWAFPPEFKHRFLLWCLYTLVVPVSVSHSTYRACRERNWLWMYHPFVSLLQLGTYLRIVLTNEEARRIVLGIIFG
jgi:glycosyltransferase involved in cell wall biosynthesis